MFSFHSLASQHRVIRWRSIHLHNELLELHVANKKKVIAEVSEGQQQYKFFHKNYTKRLTIFQGCAKTFKRVLSSLEITEGFAFEV